VTEHHLLKELSRLENLPATVEDWRDLYETIEAYKRRCLARAIAVAPDRDEIMQTIKQLAGES